MWTLLAAWSFSTSRRLFQIGILLCGVGSGFIGLGTFGFVARRFAPGLAAPPAAPSGGDETAAPPAAPARARFIVSPALMIASILLVAGFVLILLSVHYGVQPWSPRR